VLGHFWSFERTSKTAETGHSNPPAQPIQDIKVEAARAAWCEFSA
jgi:hypothetical protein